MKLYEINEELRSIMEDLVVDEETGEIIGEIDYEKIQALQLERKEKLENIALYVKELKSEVDALKGEVKKLNARTKVKENKIKSLSNYLDFILKDMGTKKFETSRVLISYMKSEIVSVDESKLPKKYMKVELSPDKVAIKKLLKSGMTIKGAQLVEKQNLQIK